MKKLKALRNVKISIDGLQKIIKKGDIVEDKMSTDQIDTLVSSKVFEVVKEAKKQEKSDSKK